MLKSLLYSK